MNTFPNNLCKYFSQDNSSTQDIPPSVEVAEQLNAISMKNFIEILAVWYEFTLS